VNGVQQPLLADGALNFTDPTGATYIAAANGARFFLGTMDEFRISKTARSADWLKTEYNNQSSPSSFYILGPLETGSSMPSPTDTTPPSAPGGVTVN
jgi:hypothetical protein